MTEDTRKKLEKIKALADDAKGKPEGIAALAMFQRLLKKYGVNEAEINGATVEKVESRIIHESGRLANWIMFLACTIAKHFRCVAIHRRYHHSGITQIVFDGYHDDLDIAQSAFVAALAVIRRQTRLIDFSRNEHGADEA